MVEDLALLKEGGTALAKVRSVEPIDSVSLTVPLQVRGQHYDLVLNGTEIAGGSVRIHDARLQEHIFENVLEVSGRGVLYETNDSGS
jgi:aspartyl-tRNA synthetase